MLLDNFAQAANAAGMTYAEYSRHRYKLARRRCGLDRPTQPQQQLRDIRSNELNSQSLHDVQKFNPSIRIPTEASAAPSLPFHEQDTTAIIATIEQLTSQLDEACKHLAHLEEVAEPQPLRIVDIAKQVCAKWGCTREHLRSDSRLLKYSIPRMEIAYRCHRELGRSYPSIARFLQKDHTSVLYGDRRYAEMLQWKAEGWKPERRARLAKVWHLVGLEATDGQDQ